MIKDTINNYKKYTALSEKLTSGLKYLFDTDFSMMKDGRYNLENGLYVNIQTYTTKTDANYEAHKAYIDIQYIISGEENIGVTQYSDCKSVVAYDCDKDIEFLAGEGKYYTLKQGEFMILYPEDAHKPSISKNIANPQIVKKAVVKVPIE